MSLALALQLQQLLLLAVVEVAELMMLWTTVIYCTAKSTEAASLRALYRSGFIPVTTLF
jgi:hypothetical protein